MPHISSKCPTVHASGEISANIHRHSQGALQSGMLGRVGTGHRLCVAVILLCLHGLRLRKTTTPVRPTCHFGLRSIMLERARMTPRCPNDVQPDNKEGWLFAMHDAVDVQQLLCPNAWITDTPLWPQPQPAADHPFQSGLSLRTTAQGKPTDSSWQGSLFLGIRVLRFRFLNQGSAIDMQMHYGADTGSLAQTPKHKIFSRETVTHTAGYPLPAGVGPSWGARRALPEIYAREDRCSHLLLNKPSTVSASKYSPPHMEVHGAQSRSFTLRTGFQYWKSKHCRRTPLTHTSHGELSTKPPAALNRFYFPISQRVKKAILARSPPYSADSFSSWAAPTGSRP
ncbi:hypothetical protein BDW22DRAFT_1345987 [Trametopsis cervina]|nr:hypothetical protein BDW22DRAFT_1345987 [Trametopsis cervina]